MFFRQNQKNYSFPSKRKIAFSYKKKIFFPPKPKITFLRQTENYVFSSKLCFPAKTVKLCFSVKLKIIFSPAKIVKLYFLAKMVKLCFLQNRISRQNYKTICFLLKIMQTYVWKAYRYILSM